MLGVLERPAEGWVTGEYDLKAHLPAHMDGAAIEAQRNRLLEQLIGRLGLPDGADASPSSFTESQHSKKNKSRFKNH